MSFLICLLLVLINSNVFFAQVDNLKDHPIAKELSTHNKPYSTKLEEYIITDNHRDSRSGIKHLYVQQTYNSIPIEDQISGIHFNSDFDIFHTDLQYLDVSNFHRHTAPKSKFISQIDAITTASNYLKIKIKGDIHEVQNIVRESSQSIFSYGEGDHLIRVKSCYVIINDSLQLSWRIDITNQNHDNYFVYVRKYDGHIITSLRNTLTCNFSSFENREISNFQSNPQLKSNNNYGSYRVFPVPLESPADGPSQIVATPWLISSEASPHGWHDTDGLPGPNVTFTAGNNVFVASDFDAINNKPDTPLVDGGENLEFIFPFLDVIDPLYNLNAAITNTFYWTNIVHDVSYQYGFDEESGNFQFNNYDRGGKDNDYLFVDVLDRASTNTANMTTTIDGFQPRLQLFRWETPTVLKVLHPDIGEFTTSKSRFGAQNGHFEGTIVPVNDASDTTFLACDFIQNSDDISGNIALVNKGLCNMDVKVKNLENAGAISVIICNNFDGQTFSPLTDTLPEISIPSMMITKELCTQIIANLPDVRVEFDLEIDKDPAFDNIIITHEYAHGISIRLTGGARTVTCLTNKEQMGEGWSDYFGLWFTMKEGDVGSTPRNIGTYVLGQGTSTQNGNGVRLKPYSTDFIINDFTYNDIKQYNQIHEIGTIWATMLWDMTWLLIEKHGFDNNIYRGIGGNNIAMSIIMEGLKLQSCKPGFVDARDAILLADQLLYEGENTCEIWEAFAKRGLGYSADQGFSISVFDGAEAYDMPPNCKIGCTDISAHNYDPLAVISGLCQTCDDNIQNGDEEQIDCGGTNCAPCPSCNDGIMNGTETGIDCGGICGFCPCDTIDYTVLGPIQLHTDESKRVKNEILINGTSGPIRLSSGTKSVYRAGHSIEILPSVCVELGAELLIDVEDCQIQN